MFNFDGGYRRKPVQAYGVATKTQTRDVLIQKAQEDRAKREKLKQQQHGALKIQAWYRSIRFRRLAREEERKSFDGSQQVFEKSSTQKSAVKVSSEQIVSSLTSLTRRLVFFYNCTREDDAVRLAWLSRQLVLHKDKLVPALSSLSSGTLYIFKTLLQHCCRCIERVVSVTSHDSTVQDSSRVNISMLLRMIEIYTDPSTFVVSTGQINPAIVLLEHLVYNDYYRCMRVLVDHRIPSSLDLRAVSMDTDSCDRSIVPPTEAAASIMSLVQRPLSVIVRGGVNNAASAVTLRSLTEQFFCPCFSHQIYAFVLASLCHSTETVQFPFVQLLHSLFKGNNSTTQLTTPEDSELSVSCTVWLLLSVLSLAEASLEKLSAEELRLLLLVLYHLSSQLTTSRRATVHDDDDDDEDVDDDYNMITEEYDYDTLTESRARYDCIEKLNKPLFVKSLVKLVHMNDNASLYSICALCHQLMAKSKVPVHRMRLLYTLAYNTEFLQKVWSACTTARITGVSDGVQCIQMLSRSQHMCTRDFNHIVPLLSVFSSFTAHFLLSLHDTEFHGDLNRSSTMPFTLPVLSQIALTLCDVCIGVILLTHPDTKNPIGPRYLSELTNDVLLERQDAFAYLFRVTVNLIKHLHDRDCRCRFCPQNHWISEHISIRADKPSQIYNPDPAVFVRRPFGRLSILNPNRATYTESENIPMLTVQDVRNLTILTEMPFVVPFQDRVKIFHKMALRDKEDNQGSSLSHFGLGHYINIIVRRSHLYEDAFEKLSKENEPNLKLKLKIQLMNIAGMEEAGIDGGGLFREFMLELIKTAFDPNRGFFRYTADKLLYPNPQCHIFVPNYMSHFYFLGRILGKALYENMLVELPFASFFLSKIISRERGNVDIHHLASLDPEMYKNLLFLKDYEGDVSDLGLDFTVVNNDLGEAEVEELKAGGRNIPVTNHNRIEYIHLMAHYRLNRQMRRHCESFREGLSDVVNIEWLTMFDHNELQVLISGAQVPIDLTDLKQHTNYSGGYTVDHAVIKVFWEVVDDFSDHQKRQLLKFVTSCSRPPLLGFKELYPVFCIHNGGSELDRLPTASTCMNLLKLPEFTDPTVMRQKLLYAIESGAGFELS